MRRVIILIGWVWFLAALPQVTDAAVGFLWFLILPASGLIIGLSWISYSRAHPAIFRTPFVRWRWLSVPALGLTATLLTMTHRDLAVRLWLCESTMTEYGEQARRDPDSVQGIFDRRIGLFCVRCTCDEDTQVLFYTASGFLDSTGVAYRPDGQLPEYVHRSEHLYGPWWWFWEDF